MRLFKSICLLLLSVLYFSVGYGQSQVFKFSENFSLGGADAIGNFYLANENQIIKLDSTGKTLFSYSETENGSIKWFDVSDPFRILIYYKEFNQVSFLDRTLSPLGKNINLDELGIFNPIGLAKSSRGGFWVIDEPTSSLLYLDRNLNKVLNVKITGLNTEKSDQWFPVIEWKDRLYICDPREKIMQFDLFGTQLKKINVNARSFTKHKGSLLVVGSNEVLALNEMPGMLFNKIELQLPVWEELHISGNHALVKQHSNWNIFRLKKTF